MWVCPWCLLFVCFTGGKLSNDLAWRLAGAARDLHMDSCPVKAACDRKILEAWERLK